MSNNRQDIVFQAEATYKDLLLRKNGRMRLGETAVFVIGMIIISAFFETDETAFQLFALACAIGVVGLAPLLYKVVLRPHYVLTRTHLIINIRGKERSYPLQQVEPIWQGYHVYRLAGKRESMMVSREFLAHLDERLQRFQRKK